MTVKTKPRRRVGCPPAGERIDWDLQPLGEMPDKTLGKILGVSHVSVWHARKVRGIKSHAEQLRVTTVEYRTGDGLRVRGRKQSEHQHDSKIFDLEIKSNDRWVVLEEFDTEQAAYDRLDELILGTPNTRKTIKRATARSRSALL